MSKEEKYLQSLNAIWRCLTKTRQMFCTLSVWIQKDSPFTIAHLAHTSQSTSSASPGPGDSFPPLLQPLRFQSFMNAHLPPKHKEEILLLTSIPHG